MPESIEIISVEQRINAQREMLKKYAPEVDIEKFLSENPLLKIDKQKQKKVKKVPQQNNITFTMNTSGQGKDAPVPEEIQKWNWGAFFLTFIWGIGNNVWESFLIFVPFFGIAVPFILGAKGSERAWQKRIWRDVAHFKKVQKIWALVGLPIWILFVALSIIGKLIE